MGKSRKPKKDKHHNAAFGHCDVFLSVVYGFSPL
jgi:hypothetical protein